MTDWTAITIEVGQHRKLKVLAFVNRMNLRQQFDELLALGLAQMDERTLRLFNMLLESAEEEPQA